MPASSRRIPLALGCAVGVLLALGVLAVAAAGIGFYLATAAQVRGSAVYSRAIERAVADPEVTAALGSPVTASWWVVGWVQHDADRGSASFTVPLRGPGARGYLAVKAELYDGRWVFRELALQVEGGQRIDVLAYYRQREERRRQQRLDAARSRARALLDSGDALGALAAANEALALAPDDPAGLWLRARARFLAGDLEGARADANAALARSDDWFVEGHVLLARIDRSEKNLDGCIEECTRALYEDEDAGEAWYVRAQCFEDAHQLRQARAGARQACDLGVRDACTMARRLGAIR